MLCNHRDVFLCLLTLLVIGGSSDATGTTVLGPATDYTVDCAPSFVLVGDVNSDTRPDLLISHNFGDSISIFLGNGDGTFDARAGLYAIYSATSIGLGRADADTIPDLILPADGGFSVTVFKGHGDGTFEYLSDSPAYARFPGISPIGDFNKDGHPDIALPNNENPGVVTVMLGNGDGTFGAYANYATRTYPYSAAIGDFNNDGNRDLVVTNSGAFVSEVYISVLLGNGDGTFQPKTDFATGTSPFSVVVGDWNRDSKLDLATANVGTGNVSVLLGNGDGTFLAHVDYPVNGLPESIASGDFDGDGSLDLAIVDGSVNKVSLLLNDGAGTFGLKTDYDVRSASISLTAADLNGDSRPDVAAVCPIASGSCSPFDVRWVSVLLNCVPCSPTAVSVTLAEAEVVRGVVRLRWITPPANGAMFGKVQRRTDATEWSELGGPYALNESDFSYGDASPPAGTRVGYRLQLWDSQDQWYSDEAWVDVPAEAGAPRVLTFREPRPNPSDGAVRFAIGFPATGHARLRIFNVSGRQVATVLDNERGPGWAEIGWDGRDSSGRPVAGGLYWARLEDSTDRITRKFVVAR